MIRHREKRAQCPAPYNHDPQYSSAPKHSHTHTHNSRGCVCEFCAPVRLRTPEPSASASAYRVHNVYIYRIEFRPFTHVIQSRGRVQPQNLNSIIFLFASKSTRAMRCCMESARARGRMHDFLFIQRETHWLKEVSEGSCAAMPLSLMLPLLLRLRLLLTRLLNRPTARRGQKKSQSHTHTPPQRPPFAQFARCSCWQTELLHSGLCKLDLTRAHLLHDVYTGVK